MAKYAVTADLKPRRTTIVSPAEVPLDFIRKFRFPQTVIPLDGGATWLRLKQPLTLVVDEKSEGEKGVSPQVLESTGCTDAQGGDILQASSRDLRRDMCRRGKCRRCRTTAD
jgi:hypothetical protein